MLTSMALPVRLALVTKAVAPSAIAALTWSTAGARWSAEGQSRGGCTGNSSA
jgi:hypothetical protein